MSKVAIIAGYNKSWTSLYVAEELRLRNIKPSLIIICYPFTKNRLINVIRNRGLNAIKNYFLNKQTPSDKNVLVRKHLTNLNINSPSLRKWAKLNNVKVISSKNINSEKSVNEIKKFNPDLTLYTGGGIIKKKFIYAANKKILNAHSGLMPYVRGMSALEWSLLLNQKPGVTTHYIDQGIDTGSILGFNEVKINANENLDSLRQKIVLTGCKNLVFYASQLLSDNSLNCKKESPVGRQCFIITKQLQQIAELKLEKLKKY